jgi:hypothetical protein
LHFKYWRTGWHRLENIVKRAYFVHPQKGQLREVDLEFCGCHLYIQKLKGFSSFGGATVNKGSTPIADLKSCRAPFLGF